MTKPTRPEIGKMIEGTAFVLDDHGVHPSRIVRADRLTSFVYIAKLVGRHAPNPPGLQLVKIGMSHNPGQRALSFRTSVPFDVAMLCKPVAGVSQARVLEAALHGAFAELRVQGEWFEVPDYSCCWFEWVIRHMLGDDHWRFFCTASIETLDTG